MEEATAIPVYDVTFYSSAYFLAFVGGILSTFTDRTYRDAWDLLAIGGISGLVACSCVGVLVGSLGGTTGSEPYYLGIAGAIGLCGKAGLKFTEQIMAFVIKRFGMTNGKRDE